MSGCYSSIKDSNLTKKTFVTVSISTINEEAYAVLMALSSGSAQARNALVEASDVTNSAGQSFELCSTVS